MSCDRLETGPSYRDLFEVTKSELLRENPELTGQDAGKLAEEKVQEVRSSDA